MRKMTMAIFTAALVLLLIPATAMAGPAPKATGGVHSSTGGNDINFEFNAQGDVTDAKGKVNWRNATNGLWFEGTVDCYRQIDEDTAVFSGTVDSSSSGWGFFIARVTDNGQPNGDVADTFRVSPGSARSCATQNAPADSWTVDRGNLVVH